jgi:hypothetical protein
MADWRANNGTRLSPPTARVKMKEFALTQDFAVLAWAGGPCGPYSVSLDDYSWGSCRSTNVAWRIRAADSFLSSTCAPHRSG